MILDLFLDIVMLYHTNCVACRQMWEELPCQKLEHHLNFACRCRGLPPPLRPPPDALPPNLPLLPPNLLPPLLLPNLLPLLLLPNLLPWLLLLLLLNLLPLPLLLLPNLLPPLLLPNLLPLLLLLLLNLPALPPPALTPTSCRLAPRTPLFEFFSALRSSALRCNVSGLGL